MLARGVKVLGDGKGGLRDDSGGVWLERVAARRLHGLRGRFDRENQELGLGHDKFEQITFSPLFWPLPSYS